MFNPFFEKLEKLLNQFKMSSKEKTEIIDDYKQMIEDGKQKGLSNEEISELIGSPEKIVSELGSEYETKARIPGGEKLIALTPFISLILFLILGITKNLWHPGWLVFLLIPVTAILVELLNDRDQYLLTALSPFAALLFFIAVGSHYGIWHPTWLIFLIIPLFGIINSKDEMDPLTFITALSPFISFIAFILIGYFIGEYQLAWLVFLSIPFLGIFHEENTKFRILLLSALVLSTLLYVFITINYENWSLALFSYLIFVITAVLTNHIQIHVMGTKNKSDLLMVILSILLFFSFGYFLHLWTISWLFLFIIPVKVILTYHKGKKLTPLSPFIAITLFMLLGYFYDLWHLSWMALLLIPIVAIMENN